MTKLRWTALVGLACTLLIGVAGAEDKPAAPAATDGKGLFLENKCNTCHTIKVAGVEKRKAVTTTTTTVSEPGEAKPKSDKKPPDLSSVGLDRTAVWMAKYLTKVEAIKGEKHARKFRGTEAELKTVTAWLETQKAPKAK